MKSSYILGLIVVIVGGIIWFNMPRREIETPVITDDRPKAEDMRMTEEEHAQMMQNASTTGTDVGMEMPMEDMPGMNHTSTDSPSEKVFMVNGTNFAFDVKEIRVKKGDTVTIHFMSADGFHDLVIDEFNVKTERIKTGGMAMATFVADKVGTFEYYCSVGSHRLNGMVGKLVVE